MEYVFLIAIAAFIVLAIARARNLRKQAAAAGIPTSLPLKVIGAVLKADQQGATTFAVVTDPERVVGPLSSIGWELRDHEMLSGGEGGSRVTATRVVGGTMLFGPLGTIAGAAARKNKRIKPDKHMLYFTRVSTPSS